MFSSISVPVLEFFQDPDVQEKVEEVGRIIWSNQSISINLGAVLALGLLALGALAFLLSTLFGSSGGADTGGGYGYGYSGSSGGDYYSTGTDYVQKRVSSFKGSLVVWHSALIPFIVE